MIQFLEIGFLENEKISGLGNPCIVLFSKYNHDTIHPLVSYRTRYNTGGCIVSLYCIVGRAWGDEVRIDQRDSPTIGFGVANGPLRRSMDGPPQNPLKIIYIWVYRIVLKRNIPPNDIHRPNWWRYISKSKISPRRYDTMYRILYRRPSGGGGVYRISTKTIQ